MSPEVIVTPSLPVVVGVSLALLFPTMVRGAVAAMVAEPGANAPMMTTKAFEFDLAVVTPA